MGSSEDKSLEVGDSHMDPGQPMADLLGRGDPWAVNLAVLQAA
ncbi:hypothetical protein [Nitrosococcus halophilus]|nr:hypothetical protein [Nitrosococcus halophilus]